MILSDQLMQKERRERERVSIENATLGASKLREHNLQVTNWGYNFWIQMDRRRLRSSYARRSTDARRFYKSDGIFDEFTHFQGADSNRADSVIRTDSEHLNALHSMQCIRT